MVGLSNKIKYHIYRYQNAVGIFNTFTFLVNYHQLCDFNEDEDCEGK